MISPFTRLLIQLNNIQTIGPATVYKLLHVMLDRSTDPLELHTLSPQAMMSFGLSEKLAQALVNGLADYRFIDQECALLEKHEIACISLFDDAYPSLLKTIYAPPAVLYVQGSLEHLSKAIAFVGSRKADTYGYRVVLNLVPEISRRGYTVVSGGALGIDTMVHQATVNASGRTIAVLGSGLLNLYPYANKKLFQDIRSSGGALVSSFPLHAAPVPGNFPARNRIIAGLSQATVVIQAAASSGALITAQCALEQSREVGAVPGPIDNLLSAGCHALLSQGAHVITSCQDLLIMLNDVEPVVASKSDVTAQMSAFVKPQPVMSERKKDQPVVVQPEVVPDEPRQKILFYCATPQSFDELQMVTSFLPAQLQDLLLSMQLDQEIEQDYSGLFKRVHA